MLTVGLDAEAGASPCRRRRRGRRPAGRPSPRPAPPSRSRPRRRLSGCLPGPAVRPIRTARPPNTARSPPHSSIEPVGQTGMQSMQKLHLEASTTTLCRHARSPRAGRSFAGVQRMQISGSIRCCFSGLFIGSRASCSGSRSGIIRASIRAPHRPTQSLQPTQGPCRCDSSTDRSFRRGVSLWTCWMFMAEAPFRIRWLPGRRVSKRRDRAAPNPTLPRLPPLHQSGGGGPARQAPDRRAAAITPCAV